MDDKLKEIIDTAKNTFVLRPPKKLLATFGTTKIHYYILTDPVYKGLINDSEDTIMREGYITAEKPLIITPYYLRNIFHGFEHGDEYSRSLVDAFGPNQPGILYKYENNFKNMTVITKTIMDVYEKLNDDLEKENDSFSTIIKGDTRLWDLSLMIFIYNLTGNSLQSNIIDLYSLGLLSMDKSGLPKASRINIESFFRDVENGNADPGELKKELDAWGVFSEYEDRFLDLFKKD